jgi:putative hydrolase of the HAD superfamily
MKVKWIFFDVGSTLLDETEAYDRRAREMIKGTEISFEEFDAKRRSLASQGYDGNSEAIKYFGLEKTPWPSEYELPYPDVHSKLSALRQKGYRLGIVANQNPGLRERLASHELEAYFDIIISSADVGVAKPDRKIFEIALDAAECRAGEAAMVGDRLDNDISPARAVGMKTVWIKNGLASLQNSSLGDSIADLVITSLPELIEIF